MGLARPGDLIKLAFTHKGPCIRGRPRPGNSGHSMTARRRDKLFKLQQAQVTLCPGKLQLHEHSAFSALMTLKEHEKLGVPPKRRLVVALQPAPRQIPSGWSEGSAPTPAPAPARVTVHVASPAPVPIVFVNTTEPAPPPPPAPNLLGGFTPSCRDLAVDIKTQSDLCDPDDVVFQYFMPITQEAQVDAMKTGFNEQLVQQLYSLA